MKLTTHFHLVSKLGMSGALPSLPMCLDRCTKFWYSVPVIPHSSQHLASIAPAPFKHFVTWKLGDKWWHVTWAVLYEYHYFACSKVVVGAWNSWYCVTGPLSSLTVLPTLVQAVQTRDQELRPRRAGISLQCDVAHTARGFFKCCNHLQTLQLAVRPVLPACHWMM